MESLSPIDGGKDVVTKDYVDTAVAAGGGSVAEVLVTHGGTAPTDPDIKTWIDLDANPPPQAADYSHNSLQARDAADGHPVGAITGLQAALDGKFAKTGGDVSDDVNIDTPENEVGNFGLKSAGRLRWTFGKRNDAESSGNAGAGFALSRWSDLGVWLGNAIEVVRATGKVIFEGDIQAGYAAFTWGADMGGYTITAVGDPTNASDAANKRFVTDRERSAATTATSVSWNSAIAPGPYNGLMHGSNNANGPGDNYYYYLTNYVYGGVANLPANHTQNMTQIAFGYTGNQVWIRNRYSSVWTAWRMVGGGDVGWQTPTLTNGWVAYDTRVPRFRKTPDGTVIVEGVVKNGTVGSNVFTMPVGYRPTRGNMDFVVSCAGGSVIFSLGTGGETTLVNQQPAGATPASYTYLNAIYNTEA